MMPKLRHWFFLFKKILKIYHRPPQNRNSSMKMAVEFPLSKCHSAQIKENIVDEQSTLTSSVSKHNIIK